MTLNEAIWKEKALAQSFRQRIESMETTDPKPLEECEKEHEQIAEWLRELKAYRDKENCNKPYWEEMEILTNAYDIMGDKTWASKMRCSNCNFITYAIEGKFSQYNYCPQCGKRIGAKYEEVKADDEGKSVGDGIKNS